MAAIANYLVALSAAGQIWCLVLGMFLWRTPLGVTNYDMTQEFANASAKLAANQGLYNGFLAMGLMWSLVAASHGFELKVFFLVCAIVAGSHCAATVSRRIFYVQALPAIAALTLVLAAGK
ncbi:DUF1304 domain-containing protein [Rhodoblastus sp.]|uniref:DUF1304 domain-containing protein n=1 Tax=Rhodoblastus sp. TaxID=1962975 RepID=UPI0026350E23|nr:DUF1304 domain-containing protein [Rhodoblastus sp.]